MKYLFIVLLLCSCSSNIEKTKTKKEVGTINQEAIFGGKFDLDQPSMNLRASGNATILIGDSAVSTKLRTETKKVIKVSSAWDMTLAETYSKYSTMTFIFLGLGLLLIVYAIKRFEKTSGGRIFSSINGIISNKLQHSSANSEEFRFLQAMKTEIESKKENYFKRG